MSVQSEIDRLLRPATEVGGLARDRAALASALALGTEGGKRFRPWLLTTVHDAVAHPPAPDEVVDRVAAAVELLHTAFVIHDDVIDHDDTRRGKPSVPGWFRADARSLARPDGPDGAGSHGRGATEDEEVYTRAGALLAGDLALAAAVRAVATCGAGPDVVGRLLDLLDTTLHVSAAGELADVRLTLGDGLPTREESLEMAECKTAAYSFVLPMQAGAVLAGAEEHAVRALGEIGRRLGIAFQLHDDLQGVFGDAQTTGKDPLGDLREGKRTLLVVHASGTAQWSRIAGHLGDPELTEAQAVDVRAALVDSGSRAYVEELAARHLRAARDQASVFDLDTSLVDPLASTWQPRRPQSPEAALAGSGLAEAGAA
ncbi:polyprenyl synthetase family protein [Nocardioides campestrisoli]|uniref:polyprenyl synthetase family protein n=1 Tax=Nocardioides campestrisoli TaxID=2736757 RepID=UPI0015E7180F|nr:polyprenyl synthetase family protein [Nocardioides campestrisoli]